MNSHWQQVGPDGPEQGPMLYAAEAETSDQRFLAQEFEELFEKNQKLLYDFDPSRPGSDTRIGLFTSFANLEDHEPEFAEIKRDAMLRDLGVLYEYLEPDDPDFLYTVTYRDGEFDQLRYIYRTDGVRIPLLTRFESLKEDAGLLFIRLLSDDRAETYIKDVELRREEVQLDKRLIAELGSDQSILARQKLTLDDKRAMIRLIDAWRVANRPDSSALDEHRREISRLMLPIVMLRGNRSERDARLIEQRLDYEAMVREIINDPRLGLDQRAKSDFLEAERQRRLEGLDARLKKRRTMIGLGLTAMGFVSTSGIVAAIEIGAARAEAQSGIEIGALVLGGIMSSGGTLAVMYQWSKKIRSVVPFADNMLIKRNVLRGQLRAERELADDNFDQTRVFGSDV
jgi:hypothetical protein